VVVLDVPEDMEVSARLEAMDKRVHHHLNLKDLKQDSSRKMQIVFNHEKKGANYARFQGVEFARILVKKHEEVGLKEKNEDIILVFIRQDARLESLDWMAPVTDALIFQEGRKLANAVSFAVDFMEEGRVVRSAPSKMGFGMNLKPRWLLEEGADDDGYPSAVLSGAATALRLNTFANLPSLDFALNTNFAADLELSFNLWLCADGMDVLPRARVVVDPSQIDIDLSAIPHELVPTLITTWISKDHRDAIYRAIVKKGGVTMQQFKDWEQKTKINNSMQDKCRSFDWYAKNVNPEMKLKKTGVIKLTHRISKAAPITQALKKIKQVQVIEEPHIPVEPEVPNEVPETPKVTEDTKDKRFKQRIPEPPKPRLTQGRKLSTEQLEIISHAQPVNLTYQDFTKGGTDDPHKGAREEDGKTMGYLHDAKFLNKTPPSFTIDKNICNGKGDHYTMLTKRVFVDMDAHKKAEKEAKESKKERVKIFCSVFTIESGHHNIPMIRQTWGKKCDGFMVASNKTDTSLGTVDILHKGPETYNNIWQKVRSLWSYVYDNYYDQYDFFHIGGDDLYVLVENMRLYLESPEVVLAANGGKIGGVPDGFQKPLFLGRRFAETGNRSRMFNSGGSGYTLNKAALKTLVGSFDTCNPNLTTFAEDVMVAACLRRNGILPYPTKDHNGSERYMPFAPGHHLTYRVPDKNPKVDWYFNYQPDGIKEGLEHCSERSVAFHYIKTGLMQKMHAILYHHCD